MHSGFNSGLYFDTPSPVTIEEIVVVSQDASSLPEIYHFNKISAQYFYHDLSRSVYHRWDLILSAEIASPSPCFTFTKKI